MYSLISDLNEKLENVASHRENLESAQYEIQRALSDIEDFQDAVQTLMNQLEELPSLDVTILVDIDISE